MIKTSLLLKIFNAACMQRWNDKLRPIELTELDKQAHQMMIEYILGKIEEDEGGKVDWIRIIEGGIYEYLLRSALTDIKPTILDGIKETNAEQYVGLINWAHEEWKLMIEDFEPKESNENGFGKFQINFVDYHKESKENQNMDINRIILNAAHITATRWEYNILRKFNDEDQDYEATAIKKRLDDKYKEYSSLKGIKALITLEKKRLRNKTEYQKIIAKHGDIKRLIDLCGQLRFQLRWAHIHRIPKTSVLGHLLFVAIISYLVSLEIEKSDHIKCSQSQRRYNNFFTGLFHDLPEVLTRDIVSPVKKSITGFDSIIKDKEKVEMEDKIIKFISNKKWKDEIRLFTGTLIPPSKDKAIGEFDNAYCKDGTYYSLKTEKKHITIHKKIPTRYLADKYKPRDGRIVEHADKLAAFVEALVAIENGCSSRVLHEALQTIKPKYNQQKQKEEKPEEDVAYDVMREIYTEF